MKRTIVVTATLLALFAALLALFIKLMSIGIGQAEPQQSLSAQAQHPTQVRAQLAALGRLFTTEQIQTNWFAPSFLAQVSTAQVQQIITSLKSKLGTYKRVQEDGKDYLVVFDRGSVPTKIVLDQSGQIAGLLFQPTRTKSISLEEAAQQFKALPGKVSFVILEGKSERAALNATTPMAVGSAFKLAVLNVLKSQVLLGKHSWHDVIELQQTWKSLPSGFLQTWPNGSLLTLQTLATLMISQSDNTAADTLIHLVGREAIEAMTSHNRPFLTTREAFILKSTKNRELLQRYRAGDAAIRKATLDEVDKLPLPAISDVELDASSLDIEWFFSTQELCTLMEKVKDLPLMSINPGVADPKDWERIAYKGGSEPGVLNLTTWLAKNGKSYCVAATWNNNTPLEEKHFADLYGNLIAGLKSAKPLR